MDSTRRYDIDWLRVIAIGLLIIYHIAIVFQPWGLFIGFIQSSETSEAIWIPMSLINIWRIPLLFFVSGMGVCFALRNRDWKQLLMDRAQRILLPLVFGIFAIVPIHVYLFQTYYEQELSYSPNMGHLWFLANILIYVLQTIGMAFLDKSYDNKFFNFFKRLLKKPYFLYLFMIPFILEAVVVNPDIFTLYYGSGHGFILGMFAFFFGFLFVAIGKEFWNAVDNMKFVNLAVAFGLYLVRYFVYDLNSPNYLISIESMSWIFAVFGLAYKYLNRPSRLLSYLSQSVYPVYIIHMIFLYWMSLLILPLGYSLEVNFLLIIILTFVGCYLTYDLIIKRVGFLRPLFGLKGNRKTKEKRTQKVFLENP
ncbi:MAG: acyltransferase family protein [Melioribacteraceae bacterium]|nr:acyltransferase family protein [Melioribacteraceae bacterium]MCF8263147.1 acyltransferase family protein [Melioribacteraceae bacterium]MCF8430377.1 acyltransferase family protein [Melioribacteraceae bacterium]